MKTNKTDIIEYCETFCLELNDFFILYNMGNLFVNAIVFKAINPKCTVMWIELTYSQVKKEINISTENIDNEFYRMESCVGEKNVAKVYDGKKLSIPMDWGDIYIVALNEREFWSKSKASEDAKGFIIDMLNGLHGKFYEDSLLTLAFTECRLLDEAGLRYIAVTPKGEESDPLCGIIRYDKAIKAYSPNFRLISKKVKEHKAKMVEIRNILKPRH